MLIGENVSLLIEPGVTIKFNGKYRLIVSGELISQGTSEQLITFTSNKTQPSPKDWEGIIFNPSSVGASFDSEGNYLEGSIIQYSLIEYTGDTYYDASIGGAIRVINASPFIDKNIIQFNHFSFHYDDGGAIGIRGVLNEEWYSYPVITRNIIKDNIAVTGGGVCVLNGGAIIKNNNFLRNQGTEEGGAVYIWGSLGVDFLNNRVEENISKFGGAIHIRGIFNEINHFSYNSFVNNSNYEIYRKGCGNININFTENWWGTTVEEETQNEIFDYFDDLDPGIINYSLALENPDINTPAASPVKVYKSSCGDGVFINWIQNQDSGIAGYKVYSNLQNDYSYSSSIDVGNVNSICLSDLNLNDQIVVTSYNELANGVSDIFEGHESWYSEPAQLCLSSDLVLGSNYCFGDQIVIKTEVYIDYLKDNIFYIELSDKYGSFDNPVILTQIDTTSSFIAKISLPDTLEVGIPYLIRVKSTNPKAYSENLSFTIYQVPTSTFDLDVEQLCGSESAMVSYTGNATKNATYNWDFDGGNIISGIGQGDYEIKWDTPGNKNISLAVTENGCYSESYSLSIPVYNPVSDFSLDNIVCENLNTIIEFIGFASGSATFNWDFDNAKTITGSDVGPYEVNWDGLGTKNISLTINDNGCMSATTTKSIDHNPFPAVNIAAPARICYNGIANIIYTGSAAVSASYNWDFDGGTIISGTGIGPYEVAWSNDGLKSINLVLEDNGCSSDTLTQLIVNPQTQSNPICMVTVSESNNNMIVWEMPDENPFESIVIYKELQSEVYNVIGIQSVAEPSFFIDEDSNPSQNSSRYKLSVIDTCGNETPLSDYHKTMHLTINAGLDKSWNLIWDKYEGFDYGTFQIYRGTSDKNLKKIAELPSNTFTYTDLTPPSSNKVYYQITVDNPYPCTVSSKSSNRTQESDYSTTHSNIVTPETITSTSDLDLNSLKIFPNPVSSILNIHSDNSSKYNYLTIKGIDGRIILNMIVDSETIEIDISSFSTGIYLLKLGSGSDTINKKIMKY